jgi:hypothetical protein
MGSAAASSLPYVCYINALRIHWGDFKNLCAVLLALRGDWFILTLFRKVLLIILGLEKDDATVCEQNWQHNEFTTSGSSLVISRLITTRVTEWAGHLARTGNTRNACKILVGKHLFKLRSHITSNRRKLWITNWKACRRKSAWSI